MTNYNTEPEFAQTLVLPNECSKKLLIQTYVRVTMIPEQTFGVDIMVQSWAMGSNTASMTTVRSKTAVYRRTSVNKAQAKGLRAVRLLFFVLAFALLFSGFTLMRTFASEEQVQPAAGSEIVISADAGDSLWSLATSFKKDSLDTREAVHLLMKRNGLTSSSLQNGQTLIVPKEILP
jgi:hypothetical protein